MKTKDFEKKLEKMFNPDGSVNQKVYDDVVKSLHKFKTLYTVLSPSKIQKTENGKLYGVPFAGVVYNRPVIYLFTDKQIAESWCNLYKESGFINDSGKMLISTVSKENEYSNIFPRCLALGIGTALVNEGARYCGLSIEKFISDNKLSKSITMPLTESQVNDIIENNRNSIHCELPVLEAYPQIEFTFT